MYDIRRHLAVLGSVLCVLLASSQAHAWIEIGLKSDNVRIELQRNGSATVSHELVMKIRGGPLHSFDVLGVDDDANVLPNANVSPAKSGSRAATPTPLLAQKLEDGTLRLEIDNKKGLRRGTYLFRFAYATNFLKRDMLTSQGRNVEVRWVGPRFPDGISSARVVFAVPRSQHPPTLPSTELDSDELGLSEEFDGVFLSTLRHAEKYDELEVVRPHVAKGEPVVWRVRVDPNAFDAFSSDDAAEVVGPRIEPASQPYLRATWLGGAVAIALFYALLVGLKGRYVARAAKLHRATSRPLVPLPLALRAALAGCLLTGSLAVFLFAAYATIGGLLLIAAMALATHLSPLGANTLRGPGSWQSVTAQQLAEASRPKALPGRWLDAGSLIGFFVFALLLAGFAAGSVMLFHHSQYHSMLVAMSAACLVPIFLHRSCL